MQALMGQTDSTLSTFLNMYGYGDPDEMGQGGEDMMETKLLRARQELINAVRTGATADSSQALNVLLELHCPVSMKYAQLSIRELLQDNCQTIEQLKTIPTALSMLEKYGRHLLKPPSTRVSQWRQINFNNAIFKDRVLPMQGALELVQQMGYSLPTDDGLLFAEEEPNTEVTSQLVADIVLARAEIERYLAGKHPHPDTIHALLPENTIDQAVLHWEHPSSLEAGSVNINPLSSSNSLSCSIPLFNTPTPVSAATEREVQKGEAERGMESLPTAETTAGDMDRTMSSSQLDDSLQKACDICGEMAASLWCDMCDNKQLCGVCDDMWHKHPKRQNHSRQPIASLPSPSSNPPQDAIRGPFGIRALASLSGERSPTPVSRGHSRTPPPAPTRTPPPQQIEAEAVGFQASSSSSQPVSPTSSIYQRHQQQLQLYQQQQRLQQQQQQLEQEQQQQRLFQQQKELGSAGGEYHMSPAYGHMDGGLSHQQRSMYPSVAVNPAYQPYPMSAQNFSYPGNLVSQQNMVGYQSESVYSTPYPAASVPYPTNMTLPPFPVLEPEAVSAGGSVRGMVAISSHQRLGQTGERDGSLKGLTASSGEGAGGYTDMSLRHPPSQRGVDNGGGKGGAVPPASIPVFGGGRVERRQSGQHLPFSPVSAGTGQASVSESSLLKTVLAETDYEKRAAKCDVRLLTLEEDLHEVEAQLNELMLRDEDVTECDDFRTLNRRKARLMKEHRALRDYRQELANLMSAEAPAPSDRGPHPATHIYHPPPLAASTTSSPSPSFQSPVLPVSTSPTQQQLGFSYPHQASQSPVSQQELLPMTVYRQPPAQIMAQSQVSFPSPAMQESSSFQNFPVSSGVDRSSILSQWQMMPPTAVSSPPSSSTPLYPPPRYQDGVGESPSFPPSMPLPTSMLYGQGTGGQWNQVSEQNNVNQSRARKPVAQEHGMSPSQHLPPGHKDVSHYSQQNVRRQSSADLTYGNVGQSAVQPIGFENCIMQVMNSQLPRFQTGITSTVPEPPPQHPPPRLVTQLSARAHTPSPPRLPSVSPPCSSRLEAPSQRWECSHCTFINEAGTRVCTMCDRTSDSPTLISSTDIFSAPAYNSTKLQFPSSATHVGGAGGLESGGDILQQLAQVERTLAEEQDQVYLEKKEAHRQFNKSQASSTPTPTAPPTSTPATPPPVPPRNHPPLPLRASDKPGGAQAAESSVDREEGHDTACPHQPPLVPTSRGRDSPHVNSLESSFQQTEDFSLTMERFQEQRQLKQIELDGADLMHFVKMCDREGYSMEELETALRQNKGSPQDALQWLHKEWAKLIQVVISSTKAEGQRLEHNDVGELSAYEAKVALCQSGGDMMAAVRSCVTKRKELYQRLNPKGSYAREEVLQAMLQSQGEEASAIHQLRSALLIPFLQRVWAASDHQEGGARGTLLQMSNLSNDRSCQSVSTSVISHPDFQSTMMDQNIDRERRIRMILVEGKLKSWGRAEMVIKLLDTDLPQTYSPSPPRPLHGVGTGIDDHCLPYTLEDVVEAVRNCQDRQSARVYLTQECSTCFSHYPMSKIRNLNFCQCKMCQSCLKQNFEVVIREKHVRHWTCPICGLPDLNSVDVASEYLAFLAMLLQTQVDREVYELFETKVRDWHLQKDPNFRWCAHCGNGFIADERQLRMVCPHCHAKTCYSCKKQWEDQHEGLTCAEFEQWKIDNDPTNQAIGLARHLEENGIDCPSCKMRYALAKGGCMHFKCPQCGHEFCSGCYQPFYQRGMCSEQNCKLGGLHAHHPRDCFFYLRDSDVQWLQNLLKEFSVEFNTDPPEGQEDVAHCPVIEQKEFDSGHSDESCGKETLQGHAGLCVVHYKEYLVGLINKNQVDPVIIMNLDDMKTLLKRCDITCPKPSNNESESNFRKRIMKFIKDKVPLSHRGP